MCKRRLLYNNLRGDGTGTAAYIVYPIAHSISSKGGGGVVGLCFSQHFSLLVVCIRPLFHLSSIHSLAFVSTYSTASDII